MHSSRLPWLAVAAAALLAGCQVFGSSPSGSSSAQVTPGRILSRTPQAVGTSTGLQLTTQVKRDTLTENVTVNGQATPLLAARLVAPFAGTVTSVLVRSGQTVRAGERLVELRPDPLAIVTTGTAPAGPLPAVSVLNAPFDGVVAAIEVIAGQYVESGSTVARVTDPSRYVVLGSISEYDVGRLQSGQSAEITFPSVSEQPVTGTVLDVSQFGVTQGEKVAFPVRVQLDGTPPGLRAGMTAIVNVPLRKAENVLYVPSAALRQVGDQTLVTKISPIGEVRDQVVEVGSTFGTNVEILFGLADGDTVAVSAPSPGISLTPTR